MKKQIIYYVLAIFLVSLNLRLSISAISPVLENIKADLHFNNAIVSLLTAIPVFCMGFFAFFATRLSAKFGLERTIAGFLVLLFMATIMRAFISSAIMFLLTAFFIGIAIAIIGPLISGYIKQKFPNHIGMMIGVYTVSMGVGASLSAGLMIPLQQQFNGSWAFALASWSVFAVIAFLFWMPTLKETVTKSANKVIKLPLKSRKAWTITIIFCLQSGLFYCISTWLAPIAQSMGYSSHQAGVIVTFFTMIQVIFNFLLPTLADTYQNEKAWLIISTLFVLIGLLVVIFNFTNLWVAAALLGIGLGGLFPLVLALPLIATSTSGEASSWTAMMQGFGYIFAGTVPIIAGITKDLIRYDKQIFVFMLILCGLLFITLLTWKENHRLKNI